MSPGVGLPHRCPSVARGTGKLHFGTLRTRPAHCLHAEVDASGKKEDDRKDLLLVAGQLLAIDLYDWLDWGRAAKRMSGEARGRPFMSRIKQAPKVRKTIVLRMVNKMHLGERRGFFAASLKQRLVDEWQWL